MSEPVEPNQVALLVERYVSDALSSAAKYDNSEPLDEDGIYGLHDLAAKIYALGFYDGTCLANERQNRRRQREHDKATAAKDGAQ